MKKPISKVLLAFILISYILIILPTEKWNILMIQALFVSIFGVYNIPTFLYVVAPWVGCVAITGFIISKAIPARHFIYLRIAILLLYVPVIGNHISEFASLTNYDHLYYVLPELFFITLSITALIRMSDRKTTETIH